MQRNGQGLPITHSFYVFMWKEHMKKKARATVRKSPLRVVLSAGDNV